MTCIARGEKTHGLHQIEISFFFFLFSTYVCPALCMSLLFFHVLLFMLYWRIDAEKGDEGMKMKMKMVVMSRVLGHAVYGYGYGHSHGRGLMVYVYGYGDGLRMANEW